ncbi:MAG: hypothetical protein JWO03_4036, partial [Bacteroidetes bacterium]|nr:hypothetical protein [Bacteroidota bacterium]
RTKSFVYYNLDTKTVMDKEPAIGAWDMVFTRYNSTGSIADPTKDMGILTNDANSAYAASGTEALETCYAGQYSNYINVIDETWRDQATDTIIPGLAYFVSGSISGNYRLTMTQFGTSYTGLMGFNIVKCAATGINDVSANGTILSVYPVPVSDVLHVSMTSEAQSAGNISMLDMSGRMITSQSINILSGDNNFTINTAMLQSGNYVLSVSSEAGKVNRMVSVVR